MDHQFPAVFEFHQSRFAGSDSVPVLFGGDFNAVPHTDGGDSPASIALMDAGFTDAFRSLHPNVEERPGPTHQNGRRIAQLYYKGAGLTNPSTRVVSTRSRGFPSDHFMILSTFDLDYSTREIRAIQGRELDMNDIQPGGMRWCSTHRVAAEREGV